MEFIAEIPVWLLAPLIFGLRVVDVSIGTVRTLAIVEGKVKTSVVLGFFEVLVWLVAITQVVARLDESPLLPLVYAELRELAGIYRRHSFSFPLRRYHAAGGISLEIQESKSACRTSCRSFKQLSCRKRYSG